MESNIAIERLSALAHEGRLDLLRRLVRAGPDGVPAGDLAKAAAVNFTTASAQLSVLGHAGLVTKRRDGRSILYAADYTALRALIAFLMEDCCQGRAELLAPLAEIAASPRCCDTS